MRRTLALLLPALAAAGALAACGATAGHEPDLAAGRRLFVATGCGRCHSLADAGTRGGIGPNFDTSEKLDRAQVLQALVEGVNGMPSFAHRLTPAQRRLLAGYLVRVAWRGPAPG